MKSLLRTLCILALSVEAADAATVLRITEVMSSSGIGGTADWFEVTNYGDAAADITGYKMDDNSFSFAAAAALNGVTTIAPGESVVFIEGSATDAANLKTYWGGLPGVQVGHYSGSGVSLGSGGDGVALYTAAGTEVTRVTFGAATAGSTFYYVYNASGALLSSGAPVSSQGSLGAFTSTGSPQNTGSPGISASSLELAFTSSVKKFATTAKVFSSPVTFQKKSGSDVATLSIVSGPAWLSLSNATQSGATLTGTPTTTQAGPQTVTLRLSVPGQTPVEQTSLVTVFAAQPRIVLNEYNAVGSTSMHASQTGDLRLGRVEGNGGDWFELVVVGSGFGTTLDMRGWKIQVSQITGAQRKTDTITLSQDNFWAAVPAGMILTFTEDNAAEGGYDTALNAENKLSTAKYAWSNIWLGDTAMIASVSGDSTSGINVSSDDTQIAVLNAGNGYEFGPIGESTWRYPEISGTSCFYLAADPGSGIDPGTVQEDTRYSALYFGKDPVVPSTFGLPNLTATGRQPFFGINMPYFASRPWRLAREGAASYAAVDFRQDDGHPLAFVMRKKGGGPLPTWIGVSATAYYADIDLTPAEGDAGAYELELVLTDTVNLAETIEPYTVVVLPAASEVILNEYNAVSSVDFLNGGVIPDPRNGDGEDTFFQTVAGNGGNWFELAVVGNGSAGTVDMRGWKIEIATAAGNVFQPQNTIVLSQDGYWAAVPAGTILTFTQKTSAKGGLNTWINKVNRLGQPGGSAIGSGSYAWSNINLSDAVYIDQTASNIGNGISVGSSNTQFRILKPDGRIVAGPAGEGIQPLAGVSSTEICELEADPSPSVSPYLDEAAAQDPLNQVYGDGAGSTFGEPNRFSGGTLAQNFSAFQTSNSAPVFVNLPDITVAAGAAYSYTPVTQDAEGDATALSVISKPQWLTLDGNTLHGTAGAAGTYEVQMLLTDSRGASTPLKYSLKVTGQAGVDFATWSGGAAAGSDNDRNGFTALTEFAFGATAPGGAFARPVHQISNVGGTNFLTLTANVRTNGTGLSIAGQKADNLAATNAWSSTGVDYVTTGATNVPAGCEQRIYRTPVAGSARFLRLQIIQGP